jgi:hypothetical protein
MKFPVPTARHTGHSGRGWKSRMKKNAVPKGTAFFVSAARLGDDAVPKESATFKPDQKM